MSEIFFRVKLDEMTEFIPANSSVTQDAAEKLLNRTNNASGVSGDGRGDKWATSGELGLFPKLKDLGDPRLRPPEARIGKFFAKVMAPFKEIHSFTPVGPKHIAVEGIEPQVAFARRNKIWWEDIKGTFKGSKGEVDLSDLANRLGFTPPGKGDGFIALKDLEVGTAILSPDEVEAIGKYIKPTYFSLQSISLSFDELEFELRGHYGEGGRVTAMLRREETLSDPKIESFTRGSYKKSVTNKTLTITAPPASRLVIGSMTEPSSNTSYLGELKNAAIYDVPASGVVEIDVSGVDPKVPLAAFVTLDADGPGSEDPTVVDRFVVKVPPNIVNQFRTVNATAENTRPIEP